MSPQLYVLVKLLSDGRFHSGDQLGKSLGVGRSAIWKSIRKVRELGIDVHSVRGKGYKLNQALDLLSSELILSELSRDCDAKEIELEILSSVDSTNSYVQRRLQQDSVKLSKGGVLVCLAEYQEAGKGRRGRSWVSPFGQNMYLSLAREFNSGILGLEGMSLVVGLSLIRALEHCGVEGLGLKWPNDVLWDNKKLAGILLEVTGDVTGTCQVIVGIGLNIKLEQHSSDEIDQPWVDLSTISNCLPSRNKITSYVISELIRVLHDFERYGFSFFIDEWDKNDVLKGKVVEIMTSNNQKEYTGAMGVAAGVSESGAFLLRTESGVKSYNGGEIGVRMRVENDT